MNILKICAVSQSFYPHTGGVSYYLLWLGRRFRKLGHKLCVIHLRPGNASAEDVIENIKVYRTPKQNIDPRELAGYTKFKELILKVFHGEETSEEKLVNKHLYGYNEYMLINKFFEDTIREVYEKDNFDILHVHDFQILPLGSMLKDLPIPKIFTWHIPFTDRVPARWREFIAQHMQQYDKVVLSTRLYVATAIQSGLSWEKVVCISPFIIIEKPKENRFRVKYGIRPEERMVLCVARIDPLKGQDCLLKALPRVIEKIPNLKCVFIGNGSMTKEVLKADDKKRFDQELRELVKELGLEQHVIFTGHIPRDDVNQAYDACDIVVLPSIQEGFGLAITEGMSFGKPVIGSAIGGIMMQIWPGTNGYLVEPGNVNHLSEALLRLLMHNTLRKRLGRRGRAIYQKNYSLERGVRDNIELYKEVLWARETGAYNFKPENIESNLN